MQRLRSSLFSVFFALGLLAAGPSACDADLPGPVASQSAALEAEPASSVEAACDQRNGCASEELPPADDEGLTATCDQKGGCASEVLPPADDEGLTATCNQKGGCASEVLPPADDEGLTATCNQKGGCDLDDSAINDPPGPPALSVIVSGRGVVTSAPAGIVCGSTCTATFPVGTFVTLVAQPQRGSVFVGWSGSCSGASTSATVTLRRSRTCEARFVRQSEAVAVKVAVAGAGTITSAPAGIHCGADCLGTFHRRGLVTLTATAAPGWRFAEWTGDCHGTAPVMRLARLASQASCSATFVQLDGHLTVGVEGRGAITSAPSGIDCGSTCSAAFARGERVTLSAASTDARWRLVGWAGDCSGSHPVTTVRPASESQCSAIFEPTPRHRVAASVVGEGRVTIGPAGLSCTDECSLPTLEGAPVTFTAEPLASGWTFAGWSGDCAGAGATVSHVVDGKTHCVATFEPPPECAEFVYIEDGQFMLEGQPYQLKGVNMRLYQGAAIDAEGLPLGPESLFLAPDFAATPNHEGVCVGGTDPARCCHDAESCRQHIIERQIEPLLAAGVNSVRLLMGWAPGFEQGRRGEGVTSIEQVCQGLGGWHGYCRYDLMDAAYRARHFALIREAIRLLGRRGIRTVLLLGLKEQARPENHAAYLAYLTDLATALADEPYLIGYDTYNEPNFYYPKGADLPELDDDCAASESFCKASVHHITRNWFDTLTAADANHLVTTGLIAGSSIEHWDPTVVWDHFTSWHLYPPSPWEDQAREAHGATFIENQIFLASLVASGRPCPYAGTDDGRGCLVATGPLMPGSADDAFVFQDVLGYPHTGGADPCPVGYSNSSWCVAGSFVVNRDTPRVDHVPHFYVDDVDGACPPGATFDGANCLMGIGPAGSVGHISVAPPGQPRYFYYEPGHSGVCDPPRDAGQTICGLTQVPTGWSPFLQKRPLFYLEYASQALRKPAHFGETGFSVYPNGYDLDPASYQDAPEPLQWLYQQCLDEDGELKANTLPQGDLVQQSGYLAGAAGLGFKGLFASSHACGFQGMHWWLMHVARGECRENLYGLFAPWYTLQDTPPGGDGMAVLPLPAMALFRDLVDYREPPATHCEPPAHLTATWSRGTENAPLGAPTHRYGGRVLDGGAPVPFAVVGARVQTPGAVNTWDHRRVTTIADADGRWEILADACLVEVSATAFGKTVARNKPLNACVSGAGVVTQPEIDLSIAPSPFVVDAADIAPPSTRRAVCLEGETWHPSAE